MTNTECYLAFSYCLGIGPMKFKNLLQVFGEIKKAYSAPQKELLKVLGQKTTTDFIIFRNRFNAKQELKSIQSKKIEVITQDDPEYPPQLLTISDAPICIYIKGNRKLLETISEDERTIAVVGTRKATWYGLSVTEQFVKELISYGFVIISGLALGVDSKAHFEALEQSGSTIAVLGCGVNIVYPPQNKKLYDRILANHGLIISEFPPEQQVLKGLFVARNRIISALSKAVLVIEGDIQSGALITARNAGEQGRDLYAVPGPITSALSNGPNMLIKNGAKVVTNIQDILEDFNIGIKEENKQDLLSLLSGNEKIIVEKLFEGPYSADDLTLLFKISIQDTLQSLTILELNGVIKKTSEGTYVIK